MKLTMPPKWYQKVALVLLLAYLLYALLAFVLVATLGKSQLVSQVEKLTGKQVKVSGLWFNPFSNSLVVNSFSIRDEQSDIIAFEHLAANMDLLPLLVGKLYVKSVELVAPQVRVELLADGNLNLASLFLIDEISEDHEPQDSENSLPIVPVVASVDVFQGKVTFADYRLAKPTEITVEQIGIKLTNVSLVEGEKAAVWFEAALPLKGRVAVDGELALMPLSADLYAALKQINLSMANPWLADLMPLSLESGELNSQLALGFDDASDRAVIKGDLSVTSFAASVVASSEEVGDVQPLLSFNQLSFEKINIDTQHQKVALEQLLLDQLAGELEVFADGTTTLDQLMAPLTSEASEAPKSDKQDDTTQNDWQLALGQVAINAQSLSVLHRGLQPAYQMGLNNLSLELADFDNQGTASTLTLASDIKGLPLEANTKGIKASSHLKANWTLQLNQNDLVLEGDAGLTETRFDDTQDKPLMSFERFDANGLSLDTATLKLSLNQLALNGLVAAIESYADGSNSIDRLMPTLLPQPNQPATKQPTAHAEPWQWRLNQLSVGAKKIEVKDYSTNPPFDLSLQPLDITLQPLGSNDPKAQLAVKGKLDGFAPLTIDGTLEQLSTRPITYLDVVLKNYDMKALSPYTGRYISYLVDKGRLSIDSKITLNDTNLKSQSKVTAEQFFLGDKIKSEDAVNAPIKFGLSVLRDRKGNILLPLSVEGDLADPSVSVAGLIVKTIMNVLTKAATAPLSVLSGLVGGVDLEKIAFAPGTAELNDEQLVALQQIADVMEQRPQLALGLAGRTNKKDASLLIEQGKSDKKLDAALMALAEKRVAYVMDKLVNDFNVPSDRLAHEAAAIDATLSGVSLSAIQL